MAGIAAWSSARAEQLPHGTRARYVGARCRCPLCTAANTAYYHQRQAARKAAALEQPAPSSPGPIDQAWTPPGGTPRFRSYRRACPGLEGETRCPSLSHLRKDSTGGRCARCNHRLTSEALIDAGPVRAHLLELRSAHVGRRAVGAAADVADSLLSAILCGDQVKIRPSIARRILAVDGEARADGSLVPAGPTWKRIRYLMKHEGFSKAEIARRLGFKREALQFGKRRVLAATAAKVERFYRLQIGE